MIVEGTDIKMTRGDTECAYVAAKKDGGHVPFIDGDILYFTVKTRADTVKKELQKVITEFPDGKALIVIEPEDTKNLQFKTYEYDLQLTDTEGRVITLIKPSKFIIDKEITYE